MKKGVLGILAFLFAVSAHAQFGIKGGINFSNYTFRVSGQDQPRDGLVGFNTGIFYRTRGGYLGVQPSLVYTVKGARNYEVPQILGIDHYTNKLHYLQFSLPITLQIPVPGGWHSSFDIGAGPYFGALLDANSIAHATSGAETKVDYSIGNNRNDDYRPLDAGVTFLMGIKFHRVGFYLGYDAGLYDIAPASAERIYNRNFNANLHIFF